MRDILIILAIGVTILYFTIGIRIGYLTEVATQYIHANGTNKYSIRVWEENHSVGISGPCDTSAGTMTVALYNPQRQLVQSQTCKTGKKYINLVKNGSTGFYMIEVTFKDYSGNVNLKLAR